VGEDGSADIGCFICVVDLYYSGVVSQGFGVIFELLIESSSQFQSFDVFGVNFEDLLVVIYR
jgi:hypothetical protein